MYVRNLTDDVDEKLLGEVFGAFGDTEKVPVPHLLLLISPPILTPPFISFNPPTHTR